MLPLTCLSAAPWLPHYQVRTTAAPGMTAAFTTYIKVSLPPLPGDTFIRIGLKSPLACASAGIWICRHALLISGFIFGFIGLEWGVILPFTSFGSRNLALSHLVSFCSTSWFKILKLLRLTPRPFSLVLLQCVRYHNVHLFSLYIHLLHPFSSAYSLCWCSESCRRALLFCISPHFL